MALGAAAFIASPAGADGAIAAFLAAVVVVLAAIDLDHRIVPNRIVLPAALIVLVARLATPTRTFHGKSYALTHSQGRRHCHAHGSI